MPTDEQYEMFREMMQTLMAKTKEELVTMLFDPRCPPIVVKLIKEHPALLGSIIAQTEPVTSSPSASQPSSDNAGQG